MVGQAAQPEFRWWLYISSVMGTWSCALTPTQRGSTANHVDIMSLWIKKKKLKYRWQLL